MSGLPIISIKSKDLQSDLGVHRTKSAKAKVLRLGWALIDGEFVVKSEVEQYVTNKLSKKAPPKAPHGAPPDSDIVKGSSFEDFANLNDT